MPVYPGTSRVELKNESGINESLNDRLNRIPVDAPKIDNRYGMKGFGNQCEKRSSPAASAAALKECYGDELNRLESEAIFVLREVAAEFEHPVILFSGGKDSLCVVHLAQKAFLPEKLPFPLLHVDTGHNFDEVLKFRDELTARMGATLIVRTVDDLIARNLIVSPAPGTSRNRLQSLVLLESISELRFDAIIGGARRDEEKSRAKERIFSWRDSDGRWNPHRQRPEFWQTYNTLLARGESMRVFPLSNWTELDVWRYIARENLTVPSLYYSHYRAVVDRGGQLLAASQYARVPSLKSRPESLVVHTEVVPSRGQANTQTFAGDLPVSNEFGGFVDSQFEIRKVRSRTVGDITCTGFIESSATDPLEIIAELKHMRLSERASRLDDQFSPTAMEERKREGYF